MKRASAPAPTLTCRCAALSDPTRIVRHMRGGDVQRLLVALIGTVVVLLPSGTVAAAALPPAAGRSAIAGVHTPIALPQGGTKILGHYRVVAFYGGVGGGALGVLGSKPPAQIADDIVRRARAWRGFGRPVQPAMELIVTVAQGSPGADGTYSKAIPRSALAPYVRVAHRRHLLLILDFQPGRAQFLDQVRRFRYVLTDPWVSVALDPEWKMGPHQVPAQIIGHSMAAPINAVQRYLSGLVAAEHLPDKLLVVHQFRPEMLPDRSKVEPGPGVEVVFHADGFGTPRAKLATWRRIALPGRPYGTGFKLFLRQDDPMMTPQAVMQRRPAPDLITYQ